MIRHACRQAADITGSVDHVVIRQPCRRSSAECQGPTSSLATFWRSRLILPSRVFSWPARASTSSHSLAMRVICTRSHYEGLQRCWTVAQHVEEFQEQVCRKALQCCRSRVRQPSASSAALPALLHSSSPIWAAHDRPHQEKVYFTPLKTCMSAGWLTSCQEIVKTTFLSMPYLCREGAGCAGRELVGLDCSTLVQHQLLVLGFGSLLLSSAGQMQSASTSMCLHATHGWPAAFLSQPIESNAASGG